MNPPMEFIGTPKQTAGFLQAKAVVCDVPKALGER